jgi:5'-methylthioadenosine phosphorylase
LQPLGIISGTLNLDQPPVSGLQDMLCETVFGPVRLLVSEGAVFLPRHGADAERRILPHEINHRANLTALRDLGVSEVVGICSTGSLKVGLSPGRLVVPDDYICLSAMPSIFSRELVHVTPELSEAVRGRLITAAGACGVEPVDGGVYWQSAGPRLETKAEVGFISQYADLAGMTMAGEAIAAMELGVPYAAICSVDNFAHGLVGNALTQTEIVENARCNRDLISRIIQRYIEDRRTDQGCA